MMKRMYILMLAVAVILIIGISIAYGTSVSVDNNNDQQNSSMFIVSAGLIFNGIVNIGCLVFLAKRYMSKVDKTDETLPALVATLKSTKEAMDKHAKSIEELYNTRNIHEIKLTQIETIHKLKGCDKGLNPESDQWIKKGVGYDNTN